MRDSHLGNVVVELYASEPDVMRVVRVRNETRPRMRTWEPKKPST